MARKPVKKTVHADFLSAARAMATETVAIPGMDRKVTVRALSAAEMQRISAACRLEGGDGTKDSDYDTEKLTLLVIAESAADEAGDRLIPAGREAELRELPNRIYAALQQAALRMNGMGGGDAAGN